MAPEPKRVAVNRSWDLWDSKKNYLSVRRHFLDPTLKENIAGKTWKNQLLWLKNTPSVFVRF